VQLVAKNPHKIRVNSCKFVQLAAKNPAKTHYMLKKATNCTNLHEFYLVQIRAISG